MTTLLTHTPSTLSDRTMLVDLTIRQWSAGKTDRQASETVHSTYAIDTKMGHYYKRLVASEHLQTIRQVANRAYNEHIRRTLPWLDNGNRILSSAGYFDYLSTMQSYEADFNTAADRFVENYDQLVQDAARHLRSLFNSADYPRPTEIRDRFSLKFTILPLSTSGDFRVDIDPLEAQRIQNSIDRQVQAATNSAVRDLVNRITDAVTHMHTRMTSYTGTRDGSFRDSLTENMKELIDLIPTLNITNDPVIADIADRMHDLVVYEPATLRKEASARTAVAETAEDILKKMSAFI